MSQLWAWVESLAESGACRLSAEESRHVSARRLRLGDPLVVFDARGRTAEARVLGLGRRAVELDVGEIVLAPEPVAGAVLASAIPKGDRLSTLLQMLTQLGVGVWQPLSLEDSAVRTLDPAAPRLRRILVESCKLARRPWALEVRPPGALDSVLAEAAGFGPVFFGDREGRAGPLEAGAALVAIGPEAGFSAGELASLHAVGARARSFAPHNLRIETAAVAAAVALQLGTAASPAVRPAMRAAVNQAVNGERDVDR